MLVCNLHRILIQLIIWSRRWGTRQYVYDILIVVEWCCAIDCGYRCVDYAYFTKELVDGACIINNCFIGILIVFMYLMYVRVGHACFFIGTVSSWYCTMCLKYRHTFVVLLYVLESCLVFMVFSFIITTLTFVSYITCDDMNLVVVDGALLLLYPWHTYILLLLHWLDHPHCSCVSWQGPQ